MIKLFIVDDHTVVIEGLSSLLQNEKDITVTGYATTAAMCMDYFKNATADVVLMDINLPDLSGVELCAKIKTNYPGIMVLALSTLQEGTHIKKMLENGASGYLLKNAGRQEITEGIRLAASGKIYLSFDAGQSLQAHHRQQEQIPKLTKREKEVLQEIVNGFTTTLIAKKLFISEDTVETHRKNLHTKLQVKNTAMLIKTALDNSLL